ncbi:DUF2474 family protein [Benzoatithermus flavus]|uniref:DUF2474 family protein n=1 Tax=Benzoatithermus flavus TaxID=3108223 RepID=A0ABU8XW38_9PROT
METTRSFRGRLAWFVLLWCAGVMAVGGTAWLLRNLFAAITGAG